MSELLKTKEGREALIWALDDSPPALAAGVPKAARNEALYIEALSAIGNSTMLGKLFVHEAKRFGLEATFCGTLSDLALSTEQLAICTSGDGVELWDGLNPKSYKLPEARALFSRLIALPDGAQTEAKKVLRIQ